MNQDDLGQLLVGETRLARALDAHAQIPEAQEHCRTLLVLQDRISPDVLVEDLPSTTLPDPQGDLNTVPQADPPALFFGWAHLGAAKGAMRDGKPDAAKREYQAALALEGNWPATRDGRQRLSEIKARAGMGLSKLALAARDPETAFRLLQETSVSDLPPDIKQERENLEKRIQQERQREQ